MEETILEIINKLQNFAIIDSSDEIQIENISSNDINIQILPVNIGLDRLDIIFNPNANILITFDNERINIFSMLNSTVTNEVVDSFINKFFENFNIVQRLFMPPRADIPFRWDELILGDD